MTRKTLKQHLATLRSFWAENRRIYETRNDRSWDEDSKVRRALGAKLVEWAKTVGLKATPSCLEEAVVGAYAQIVLACHGDGDEMCPGWETFCKPPEDHTLEGKGQWRVCWESGPDYWVDEGVVSGRFRSGPGWYTEPYYSFDLCFVQD